MNKIRLKMNIRMRDEAVDDIILMAVPAMKDWCDEIWFKIRNSRFHTSHTSINNEEIFSVITACLNNGGKVMVHCKDNNRKYRLTRKKVAKAFEKFLDENWGEFEFARVREFAMLRFDLSLNMTPNPVSYETADKMVQTALFGHVVYSHKKDLPGGKPVMVKERETCILEDLTAKEICTDPKGILLSESRNT